MHSVLPSPSAETSAENSAVRQPLSPQAGTRSAGGENPDTSSVQRLSAQGTAAQPAAVSAASDARHTPPAAALGTLPFQTGSAHTAGFQPAPLPAEWIRSGKPEPRARALTRSADGRLSSGLWECPAGSFTYIFPCDEIVHILEGDVIVESQGERRHLKPGDVAYFPQDLHTVWTVRHYVKKLAIFRVVPRPLLKRIASRLFKR
jgi:uncharacterized protein